MKEADILKIFETIQESLIRIEKAVSFLLPIQPIIKKKRRCSPHRLRGGLRDPGIRAAIMILKAENQTYDFISSFLHLKYPDQQDKRVSRSAIHRFYQSATLGRLREYGIEPPIER